MTRHRSSSRRLPWLGSPRVWVVALLLPMMASPDLVHAAGKKPKKTNGPYNVSVGGSCSGQGHAVVAGRAILINVQVTDESGARGLLTAAGLTINGSHFRGTGLVFGRPATFAGRLDGYADDKHFRGARILCSFAEAGGGGRYGRVAGVLR